MTRISLPETPAPAVSNTQTVTPLRRRGAKGPAETPPAELKLPPGCWEVLFDIQSELLKVKAIFASAYALAETNDDSSDVRWAMEAALERFESAIERVEPIMVTRAAAERGVDHGR